MKYSALQMSNHLNDINTYIYTHIYVCMYVRMYVHMYSSFHGKYFVDLCHPRKLRN